MKILPAFAFSALIAAIGVALSYAQIQNPSSSIVGSFTAGDLLVGNSSGQVTDPSAVAATYPASGIIATLGAITGGASYTTGTQILTLGSITAGTLYVDGTYTAVPLTGGTGSGAQATIIVLSGAVVKVTLTTAGTGYLAADSLSASNANLGGAGAGFSIPVSTVGYIAVPLTGGTGSGATATIRVAAGAVAAVTITNRGMGYTAADNLSATAASIGGTGSGFLVAVSTVGGTTTAGTGGVYYTNNISGTCAVGGTCAYNNYTYNADTVDASVAANGAVAWNWNLNTGGGNAGRVAGQYTLALNVAPTDTDKFYTAFGTIAQTTVNDGGTSGAGNGKGNLFGINPYARTAIGSAGASVFWGLLAGGEVDISARYGTTVDNIVGWQVTQDASSLVAANQFSAAYSANNSLGALGWDILLSDGAYYGRPSLKSTGTIFRCFPHANTGNCGTIGAGFDLTSYGTITGNAWASPGASISGAGQMTALSYVPTSSTIPTNGLYLSAANVPGIAANGAGILFVLNGGSVGISQSTTINATDKFFIQTGTAGQKTITFRHSGAGTGDQATFMFANSNSNTQANITLNGGSFSGGQGANALQISNTSTAPIVIGTGTEVIKLPSVTTGTAADVLCLTAGAQVILQAAASCTISTERIKEKIRPLTVQEALVAIEGLVPIEFKRKPEDGPLAKDPNFEAMQTGFSAENICAIEPRFCIVEPNGITPHGYRPEAVLAALTAVVQAQQAKIRDLSRWLTHEHRPALRILLAHHPQGGRRQR
jgi:hypothetical protein